jgi:anhydro-N-acetylmuramic acid kinase
MSVHEECGQSVAALGKVNEPLLADALSHPFFSHRLPKSAGWEQFGRDFVQRYFLPHSSFPSPVGEGSKGWGCARFEELLRTSLELTARMIAGALARFVFPGAKIDRLIVSGGGAHNRLLTKRLVELLPNLTVDLSERYGLPVDAKEAIAFAILADRTLQH